MSEEKYYSLERDGTYCLGFPNKHALSEKEIEEIFSDFGNVISVRASGDERGFRFVRFKLLEEAESAVDGLKSHKKVRILPKKAKTSNNNEKSAPKENSRNGQQKGFASKKKVNFNNQNKRNDGDDDMDDASKDADSSTTRSKIMPYGGVFNGSFKNNCDASKNEDSQTNIAETENMMRILRLRSMRGTVANNFNSTLNNDEEGSKMKYGKNNQSQEKEVKHDSDNIKPRRFSDFEMNKSNHEEEYIPKMKQQATLAAPLRRSDHTVFDNSSNFIQEAEAKNILNDEPPELVSTEELKQISLKGSVCSDEYVKIKLAEEVVVANVPEKFSALYILYLLENFDPISITEMKTIAQNGIRYCSVYFKSQKDAIAVEKKFDNFDLSGSKLIVRTPQLLINEVISD